MSCYLEIRYSLDEVSTHTLVEEILKRSEEENIELLNELVCQYLVKNLNPEILKKLNKTTQA